MVSSSTSSIADRTITKEQTFPGSDPSEKIYEQVLDSSGGA
jgi:hypothetical protein